MRAANEGKLVLRRMEDVKRCTNPNRKQMKEKNNNGSPSSSYLLSNIHHVCSRRKSKTCKQQHMEQKDKSLEQAGAPVNEIRGGICAGLPKGPGEMWLEMIPPPREKLATRRVLCSASYIVQSHFTLDSLLTVFCCPSLPR